MSLRPNPSLYFEPIFYDADGVEHRGTSLGDLVVKLTAYRSRNKLPPGNPEQEIYAQLCTYRPDKCIGEKKGRPARAQGPIKLNFRILAWITGLIERRKGLKFVAPIEAARRMAVCARCPAQRAWESGCKGCTANVKEAAEEILGSERFGSTKKLQGCDILGEDPRASVWLDEPAVENQALPPACWRKSGIS